MPYFPAFWDNEDQLFQEFNSEIRQWTSDKKSLMLYKKVYN